MTFSQPYWFAALLLIPVYWLFLRRRGKVGLTHLNGLGNGFGSRFLLVLPKLLFTLALVALIGALARPQRVYYEADDSIKARDIIITVDKSGSMGSPVTGDAPQHSAPATDLDKDFPGMPTSALDADKSAGGSASSSSPGFAGGGQGSYGGYDGPPDPNTLTRIKVAQAAVLDFIRNRYIARQNDRIAVMTFDIYQYWFWPLTDDLKIIYRNAKFLSRTVGDGTNFGSIDPGPIDAAIAHFDEIGKARSKVIIMVTDGEDEISPEAMQRLTDKLNSHDVHFYVVGVGETLATQQVDVMRLADAVHGHVFRVEQAGDMQKVFEQIDSMERSSIKVASTEKRDERFIYFAFAALGLLTLGFFASLLVHNQ
ncbi:MAG: VWA domain-containing protein [Cyanobacteria bacterium REEB67]|nr:VWA domain-containing protein [Cyanobacteria bacterium REEB67]